MTLRERFQIWRLRPGMKFAARLAEQQAWKHQNAGLMGPEQNLMRFSQDLNDRMRGVDAGDLSRLYLDAVIPSSRAARAT